MLTAKTGMPPEQRIAKFYADPGVLVLTGPQTVADLEKIVPHECTGIISLGVAGGLSPSTKVGEVYLATSVEGDDKVRYFSDHAWLLRLHQVTGAAGVPWYSTPVMNLADTVAQREAVFAKTACAVTDNESISVAQFAKARGIAFAAMRSLSDGGHTNLPPAVIDALNANGSTNLVNVVKDVAENPLQIPGLLKTAAAFALSLDTLERACQKAGPNFQWIY